MASREYFCILTRTGHLANGAISNSTWSGPITASSASAQDVFTKAVELDDRAMVQRGLPFADGSRWAVLHWSMYPMDLDLGPNQRRT